MRLPKKGFYCRNSKEIIGINVSALERFEDGETVTIDMLMENGIVRNPKDGVKILGDGKLTKKLTIKANAFSASAKEKVEALGGICEVV
jgi:large subunit ribosomal protein L15